MFETIAQLGIVSFGLLSVISIALKNPKMGCLWGLLAEPFWFMSSINWMHPGSFLDKCIHGSWGITILAVCYTASWSLGVFNYWFNDSDTKGERK